MKISTTCELTQAVILNALRKERDALFKSLEEEDEHPEFWMDVEACQTMDSIINALEKGEDWIRE